MAVVNFKAGVDRSRTAPAGVRILAALDAVAYHSGVGLIVTCGQEGHPPTDPHTLGEAFDVGIRGLTPEQIVNVCRTLQAFFSGRNDGPFYWQVEAPLPLPEIDAALRAAGLRGVIYNKAATAPHLHIQRAKGTTFPRPATAPALLAVEGD